MPKQGISQTYKPDYAAGGAVQNVVRGTQVNCYFVDITEGADISQGSYPVTTMLYFQANGLFGKVDVTIGKYNELLADLNQ
ncbi:hypothetical protein F8M41_015343 [Gigaspora margarita]|uniref:Uncharacterized protein n=1 Tax=Gigaspora margarita TaxID=4874 RepID=A0A8H4B394_GIGMA|nr:hypothetical protein F8M41_015343 [Gigaspora margarita]